MGDGPWVKDVQCFESGFLLKAQCLKIRVIDKLDKDIDWFL